MLTDKSKGFQETYGFLGRLIESMNQGEEHLSDLSMGIYGLWTAKNSFIDMMKEPVVNRETVEMQEEMRKQNNSQL